LEYSTLFIFPPDFIYIFYIGVDLSKVDYEYPENWYGIDNFRKVDQIENKRKFY